jgi:AraC-like DNA-binding protein
MEVPFTFLIKDSSGSFTGDFTATTTKGLKRLFSFLPVDGLRNNHFACYRQVYNGRDFCIGNIVVQLYANATIQLAIHENCLCLLLFFDGDPLVYYKGDRTLTSSARSYFFAGYCKGLYSFPSSKGSHQLFIVSYEKTWLKQLATEQEQIATLLKFADENGTGIYWLPLLALPASLRKKTNALFHLLHTGAILELSLQQYGLQALQNYYQGLQNDKIAKRSFITINDTVLAVQTHIMQELNNEQLGGLQEMSNRFFVSPKKLSNAFKLLTGKTIPGYILEQRMLHATHLLDIEKLKVAEVAMRCGFNDTSNFIRSYKRYYGYTPGKKQKPN